MADQPTTRELRWFGFMMGAAFCAASGWLFYREYLVGSQLVGVLGLFFLIAGAGQPAVLAPLHVRWMKVAAAMGWVNTRLLLALIFFLVFTPIAVIQRLRGRDPLGLDFHKNRADSYWREKTPPDDVKKHFERQF
jgi:hypothetical protein